MADISKVSNYYYFPFSSCECTKAEILTFHCLEPRCNYLGYTLNQLQEHYLDKHSYTSKAITFNGEKP